MAICSELNSLEALHSGVMKMPLPVPGMLQAALTLLHFLFDQGLWAALAEWCSSGAAVVMHAAVDAVQAARLCDRWADVQAEVTQLVKEYDHTTSGSTKWPRLATFLQQQYGSIVREFVRRCEDDCKKQVGTGRGGVVMV
jgi:hypothetical protein